MKKFLCIFLAILTLSFCLIVPVSAQGVKLEKYNYKNCTCYSVDITELISGTVSVEKLLNFINTFGFDITKNNGVYSTGILYDFTSMDNYTEKTNYFNFRNLVDTEKKLILRSIKIYDGSASGYSNEIFINIAFWKTTGRSVNMTYQLNKSNLNNIILKEFTVYNNEDLTQNQIENALIFLKNKNDDFNTYKAQYIFSNDELKFVKPNDFSKRLKVLFNDIQIVEPEEMAMRANVTYSLPYVINYVKIVINSIFTPTGSLYMLAPVAVISISISVLLLGAYIIRKFSWGL